MISKPLNNLTLKRRIWINNHSQPLLIQLGANLFDLHTSHISCNFPGQAWYRDRPMGCNPSVELSNSTCKVHQRHCRYLKNSTTSTSVSVKVHQNFCQKGHVIPTRLDAVHQSSSWVESWSGGEVRRVKKNFRHLKIEINFEELGTLYPDSKSAKHKWNIFATLLIFRCSVCISGSSLAQWCHLSNFQEESFRYLINVLIDPFRIKLL